MTDPSINRIILLITIYATVSNMQRIFSKKWDTFVSLIFVVGIPRALIGNYPVNQCVIISTRIGGANQYSSYHKETYKTTILYNYDTILNITKYSILNKTQYYTILHNIEVWENL